MSSSIEDGNKGILSAFGRGLKRGLKRVPSAIKQRLEDRLYAIFQTTRVTNDAYGWRPNPLKNPSDHLD